MNFKRNLISIIALIGSVFAISGCTRKKAFEAFSFIDEVYDAHEDEVYEDGAYEKPGNYSSYIGRDQDEKEEEFGSAYETFYNKAEKHILKATGDRKLLVIPVDFIGYDCNNLNVKPSEYISNLNKAFFGKAKNNKYVSVAEYYNRSSYGKLRISGKVCDKFYTFSTPFVSLDQYYKSHPREDVYNEYDKIISWYKENYGDTLDEFRIDPEDKTSDVAMYLVYTFSSDLTTGNRDFFWAYTFEKKPISWTSYSSMNTLNGEPDAHTFIHETGHLFGLVDYYPKGIDNDVAKNVLEPTGEIDMMDCSMGDHSALSKMFLDWARPYHVNDSCTIHINSLINKGDLILINDNWNGSVFDEYYLIELYSPFGLNSYDVTNGVVINDKVVTLPVLPGIKIYHVDARLGYFVSKTGTDSKADTAFSHYCNEIHTGTAADFGNYINFAHDNSTYPESTDKQRVLRNYLYELELNKVGHPVSGNATDINLFHKGDTFKVETFNQMNATKYEIKVKSLSFYDATIEITKIESQETVED